MPVLAGTLCAAPAAADRRVSVQAPRVGVARRVPRVLRLMRLLVVLAFVLLAVWGGDQVAQAVSDKAPPGVVHVVEPGETVWEIVVAQYGTASTTSGSSSTRCWPPTILPTPG